MNEFGGMKRSYYMDPQPLNRYEWHLYEYEISKCDACALYRLELKLVDGKKSSRAKITSDSVTDLQKRIGRLSAEFPYDNKRSAKGRAKLNAKVGIGGGVYSALNKVTPLNGTYEYGLAAPYDHLVDSTSDYFVTWLILKGMCKMLHSSCLYIKLCWVIFFHPPPFCDLVFSHFSSWEQEDKVFFSPCQDIVNGLFSQEYCMRGCWYRILTSEDHLQK